MSDRAEPTPPEALLAHAGWLRGLVRHLVRDPFAAEDVEQETWVAALQTPPRDGGKLRAWLASVARNAARMRGRSEGRRDRREAESTPPRGEPDPASTVEKLEQHGRLVALVRDLDEPFRTTVLLHYFEGMRPAEIAVRVGVPASTVRGRLQRGLALLRERLDRESGGDRGAWTAALLPLVGLSLFKAATAATAAATTSAAGGGTLGVVKGLTGGLVMGAKIKLIAAVGVLIVLALLVWRLAGDPEEPDSGKADERAAVVTDGDRAGEPAAPQDEETRRGETEPDETRPAGAPDTSGEDGPAVVPAPGVPSTEPTGTVRGRVIVAPGSDLLGAALRLTRLRERDEPKDAPAYEIELPVNPDGTFRADGLPPGRYYLVATHPVLADAATTFSISPLAGAGPLEIVLQAGGTLRVTVLDAQDAPLAEQGIRVSGTVRRSGRTDGSGLLDFERLPPGSYHVRWQIEGANEILRVVAVIPEQTTELTFRQGAVLRGTVLGPDGAPPEQGLVRLRPAKYGPEGYRSYQGHFDNKGSYTIRGIPPGEYVVTVQALQPDSYVAGMGRVTLAPGEERELLLRVPATSLSGRITRSDDGTPLASRQVQITADRVRVEDGKIVERFRDDHAMAFAKPDGTYEFTGIGQGAWELWIAPHLKDLKEARRVVEVTPGGRTANVDFALEVKRLGRLRLKIAEPDGTPVVRGVDFTRQEDREGTTWSITLRGAHVGGGVWEFQFDAGSRSMVVHRKGYRMEPAEISAEIEEGKVVDRTCRLILLGTVLVTVVDPAGVPVKSGITFREARSGAKPRAVYSQSMGNGVFRLSLDPGETMIHVLTAKAVADPIRVEVKAGEAVAVTAPLVAKGE